MRFFQSLEGGHSDLRKVLYQMRCASAPGQRLHGATWGEVVTYLQEKFTPVRERRDMGIDEVMANVNTLSEVDGSCGLLLVSFSTGGHEHSIIIERDGFISLHASKFIDGSGHISLGWLAW